MGRETLPNQVVKRLHKALSECLLEHAERLELCGFEIDAGPKKNEGH